MSKSTFLNVFSTIGYTIVLSFMLHLVNISIDFIFEYVMFPAFDRFYKIHFIYKIILLIAGAPALLYLVFDFSKLIGLQLNRVLMKIFVQNSATIIISILLCCSNIIFGIIYIWIYLQYDFWRIIMWLMMLFFIIEMNAMFLFKDYKKETIENTKNINNDSDD